MRFLLSFIHAGLIRMGLKELEALTLQLHSYSIDFQCLPFGSSSRKIHDYSFSSSICLCRLPSISHLFFAYSLFTKHGGL